MATAQYQVQNVMRAGSQGQPKSADSRINVQMTVLTEAIEKILSLRQMTSSEKKK